MGRPRKTPKKEIIPEVNYEEESLNDITEKVDIIEKEDKKLINANVSFII